MANTAYVNISAVTPAGPVPDAPSGATACARFTAVVLDQAEDVVSYNGGQLGVSDIVSVAIVAGDTAASIQARITALLQSGSYYADPGLLTVFI